MAWVIGILAILFFLWLIIVSPAFRSLVFGLVALIISGGILYYQFDKRKDERARKAILISQIEIQDINLVTEYGSYKIEGRIKNLSSYVLSELDFRVVMQDCEPSAQSEDKCNTIGDVSTNAWINVPSQQIRSFDASVRFVDMPKARGKLVWSYNITGTKAKY